MRDRIALILLYGIVPIILCAVTYAELCRNRAILAHGAEAQAVVTKSQKAGFRRTCMLGYRFRVGLADFIGETTGCPLMQRHPVGSALPIRYEPGNPARSLPVDAGIWPTLGLPALVLALAAVLTPLWLLSAVLLVLDRRRPRRRA